MDTSSFHTQGYQVLRGVLDPDAVCRVGDFLAQRAAHSVEQLRTALGAADLPELCRRIDEHAQAAASVAPSGPLSAKERDLHMQMSGHYALEDRLNPVLWEVARQDRLRSALQGMLGCERLYMHMPPTARFVLPNNRHAGVPAHQDISYNRHMTRFVTVWTPFVRIDERCGGVAVFEGSGAEPAHEAPPQGAFWLAGVPTQSFRRVHCLLEPGDALALNPWIIHASVPNTSDRVRISLDCRFFGEADASTKHHLDLQTWKVIEPQKAAG